MRNVTREERKFHEIDRRINFLRTELYNYDKYLRSPGQSDIASSAKWAIDSEGHQNELEELVFLHDFYESSRHVAGIRPWQVAILGVYSTLSLLMAGISLWMAAMR